SMDRAILVFMGLDHLTGRSGRVFRLVREPEGWTLVPFAVLDSSPGAWLVENNHVLVVTERGLWYLQAETPPRLVHELDPHANLDPDSLVRTADGTLFLGLRRYVLALTPDGDQWTETWFVPKDCLQVRLNGFYCVCAP